MNTVERLIVSAGSNTDFASLKDSVFKDFNNEYFDGKAEIIPIVHIDGTAGFEVATEKGRVHIIVNLAFQNKNDGNSELAISIFGGDTLNGDSGYLIFPERIQDPDTLNTTLDTAVKKARESLDPPEAPKVTNKQLLSLY